MPGILGEGMRTSTILFDVAGPSQPEGEETRGESTGLGMRKSGLRSLAPVEWATARLSALRDTSLLSLAF